MPPNEFGEQRREPTRFELLDRIEMLERIIIAMTSGQQFAITLGEQGHPQMFTWVDQK